MDYADLYHKEWAEFQAQARRNRVLKGSVTESTWERWARSVAGFFRRKPGQTDDPYAYAMAPKQPRSPRRGASAADEFPF
jgi:hypothetical protein